MKPFGLQILYICFLSVYLSHEKTVLCFEILKSRFFFYLFSFLFVGWKARRGDASTNCCAAWQFIWRKGLEAQARARDKIGRSRSQASKSSFFNSLSGQTVRLVTGKSRCRAWSCPGRTFFHVGSGAKSNWSQVSFVVISFLTVFPVNTTFSQVIIKTKGLVVVNVLSYFTFI